MADLMLRLDSIKRLVLAGTSIVRCTEYAVVKWADYTLKPDRYFAFEDSNGCLQVATIFSLLSVGSAYFVAFRIFTEFTISDGSVHVTKNSIHLDGVEIMDFHSHKISFSRSEVEDNNEMHFGL